MCICVGIRWAAATCMCVDGFILGYLALPAVTPENLYGCRQTRNGSRAVLPNTDCTQAAEITPPQQQRNGPVCCCMTLFAASAFHFVTAGGDGSAQHVFCPWWPWPLTLTFRLSKRGTKHVFRMNLAQILSSSRDIWFTNKPKNLQTVLKTEPRAV